MPTKRDFIAVAKMLAEQIRAAGLLEREVIKETANGLADIYQQENPRFDRERFLSAANCQ